MSTMARSWAFLSLLTLACQCRAQNPCEAEIQAACPDRPGGEMAKCLKDPSEHEKRTEISSECTDFMALNAACAEDIVKHCDDGFFTADTMLCLGQWTPERDLTRKCASVVKWAIPKSGEDEGDGPVDELGMTDKERREKAEWQANRKAGRSAAVEKLKEDRKADKELEDLRREDPVGYALAVKEREEARKSVEELKKRKRLQAAADERQRREEDGGDATGEEEAKERRRQERLEKRRTMLNKDKTNWLPYVLAGLLVAFVVFNIVNFFTAKPKKKKGDDSDDDKED
mmetsp:Transcript_155774/g.499367  ORF Transcript_155774/g.499367 Transcript_155774/m.499367 type:complete len:287 (+) Transcript_155774:112-972(+)